MKKLRRNRNRIMHEIRFRMLAVIMWIMTGGNVTFIPGARFSYADLTDEGDRGEYYI